MLNCRLKSAQLEYYPYVAPQSRLNVFAKLSICQLIQKKHSNQPLRRRPRIPERKGGYGLHMKILDLSPDYIVTEATIGPRFPGSSAMAERDLNAPSVGSELWIPIYQETNGRRAKMPH
jgi:hypothetical protein